MKRNLRRILEVAGFFVGTAAFLHAAALPENEWKYRQDFTLDRVGVFSVALPVETLDRAQPDQRDLRLVGPDGREIPFALLPPSKVPAHWEQPLHDNVTFSERASIVTVEMSEDRIWAALHLETTSPRFMKAAQLEASHDGKNWTEWSSGLPFFRQDGVEQLTLNLRKEAAKYFRVTLEEDARHRIVITGARVLAPATEAHREEAVPLRVTRSEDSGEETVLTLALPAAHLDWSELQVSTPAPLFNRVVRVGWQELQASGISERIAASDTIYRLAVTPEVKAEKTSVVLNASVPSHELLLHFSNGDSPPLPIDGVKGVRRIFFAGFSAPAAGRYSWWSGNPHAKSPRYDLAGAENALRAVAPEAISFGPIVENAHYAQPDPLAGLTLEGAALSGKDWSSRRAVRIETSGVQSLDLDLAALSEAQGNLADLRLVRGEQQIPYLLEHTGLNRWIYLSPTVAPDPARPSVSRWKITLPRSAAPINQLSFESPGSLFERRIQIVETRENSRGENEPVILASTTWRRSRREDLAPLIVALAHPTGRELWLEMENGDNPPLAIEHVRASYPLTRLIFHAEKGEPIFLLAGNREARPPQYDLALVADTLVSSDKQVATLGAPQNPSPESNRPRFPKNALFWGALSLVVIGLLVVVAKLLPKPPATPPPPSSSNR
jgi:uncharacterized protein DUF3999